MARSSPSSPTRRAAVDAAELALFDSLFSSIAEEMGACLIRTAFSPNIKERRDCSCALFDGTGGLVAQAAHIPVHLGAMPQSVRAALRACGPLQRGDAVLLNDPFAGGTHLPDLTLVSPVFENRSRGRALAYLASRAHHADVGGMSPGSLPLSREIYQEGLRLPPLKLKVAGVLNHAVLDVLLANSRTPSEREGDLRAQLAAHDVGARRVHEALERYSAAVLRSRMQALQRYARRLMAALIATIPDGVYRFEDYLDGDGIGENTLRIRVAITIRGAAATVDFDGTDPPCRGNLNAVEAITLSATYYCFLAVLVTQAGLRGAAHPPLNAGCFEPLTVTAPAGTLLNAGPPHAVACGNLETSQRIVDVVLGALAQALPGVVPAAGQGTMNNLTLGGTDPRSGAAFAYYETIAGGMGASPQAAGASAVQVHMTNTLNTPVEALEFACPVRVEHYGIRRGTGGSGQHRGGDGVRRAIRMLTAVSGTLLCERRRLLPYGLAGGQPGAAGRNMLIRKSRRRRLPGKLELQLEADDVIVVETPGGGGWGQRSS